MALQSRIRPENAIRWQKAAERAITEGIQVRQLQGSGQWIATSGQDDAVAYELEVTGNIAHGCTCLAGLHGDPCCKHKAAFFVLVGALALTPAPQDVNCPACLGCGTVYDRNLEKAGWLYPDCRECAGSGLVAA